MMRAGIQISSVRQYLQTPVDVLESFRKVSEIGYRFIQIQWISPAVPEQFIREALSETHLRCVGTQDYYDEVMNNLDEVIAMNDLWEGTHICVSGIPERCRSYDGCLAFAKELNRISEHLEERGKIFEFHPRWMDVIQFEGQNSLELILDHTRHELQFVLDIYHLAKAGLDPIAWIGRVKGRNDLVHFKDSKINPDGREVLVPVGQGSLAWDTVFQACKEAGVEFGFAEQESWQKDPFECLKESYGFLVRNGIA